MSKADRRQRARQKKRDKAREARANVSRAVAEFAATPPPAEAPAPEAGASEYITTRITPPQRPTPAAAPVSARSETRIERPRRDIVEEVEAEADEEEDDDDFDDDDFDDDDEEGDEGEEFDEEDALLNATCGAIEQGEKFSWHELVACFMQAPIEDPRLAVFVTLIAEGAEPPPLSHEKYLEVMEKLELGDIVAEAREQLAQGGKEGEGELDEEAQKLVQTTSRQLRAQSKNELAQKNRPVKASQLREQRTALSSGVVPAGGDES